MTAEISRPIVAITYADGALAAAALLRLWEKLVTAGVRCAGFLQRDEATGAATARCDMVLQCLSTGERLKISENRGPLARGCRLDMAGLMRALVNARVALQDRPDLFIVNKFGKSEGEGGGFRPLIADAVELGIPVLIAVPWRNIDSWRLFAGDLAKEIRLEDLRAESEMALLEELGVCAADSASKKAPPPLANGTCQSAH